MSVGWVAVGVAAVSTAYSVDQQKKSSKEQARAAEKAGQTSYAGTLAQIESQEKSLDKVLAQNKETMDRQIELNRPWQEAGLTALQNIRQKIEAGDQFDFEVSPGYEFRRAEMEKSIGRRAAVRGRNASPATDKEIARYVGGLASQEYENAFNRNMRQKAFDYGTEFDVANLGRGAAASNIASIGAGGAAASNAISSTASNVTNLGMQGTNALSQSYLNKGEATAAGYTGQAAALNQGVENILNAAVML